MTESYQPETLAVRAGTARSQFHEHSEAMFLTSSFVFDNAEQAAKRFIGEEPGNIYSRFTNPTVTMFEERLAALEGAEQCVATASGMSAILAAAWACSRRAIMSSRRSSLFGATVNLFNNVLKNSAWRRPSFPPPMCRQWKAAVRPNTKLFFLETPSNPLDRNFRHRGDCCRGQKCGALLAVDNCFCTPILQRPLELGADIVIHSATKYIDGQGRVLGGAVLGSKKLMEPVYRLSAHRRPDHERVQCLGVPERLGDAEAAHGRAQRQCAGNWRAGWRTQPNVARVFYPGLPSHPQHELAMKQQKTGGGIVAFEVKGGKEAAWRVIDNTKMLSITANLGDTKTTITHPATTTHARITPEARAAAGISDGLIRIAVGLEAVVDIQNDLARGL